MSPGSQSRVDKFTESIGQPLAMYRNVTFKTKVVPLRNEGDSMVTGVKN